MRCVYCWCQRSSLRCQAPSPALWDSVLHWSNARAMPSRCWQGKLERVLCWLPQSMEPRAVRHLRQLLRAWHQHAASSRAAAWQLQQAAARLLRICFVAWRQQASAGCLRAVDAQRWHRHRLLSKAMHGWARQYMACQRAEAMLDEAHEEMVHEAGARRACRLAAAALGAWRHQAWQGRQRKLAGCQWLVRAHARGMLLGWHRTAALDR